MSVVYANLGSNLGDREGLIRKALDQISERFGICCLSNYIESEPWGFESDNRFLNLGVSFCTELEPERILEELQRIEKGICGDSHRNNYGEYIDRKIDIDIMSIDNIQMCTERLKLPHPHLNEREFFLRPLQELKGF